MLQINTWFVVAFVIMWVLGSATQVLQLIAPQLHHKLGFMEKAAFEPRSPGFGSMRAVPPTPISSTSSQASSSFGWPSQATRWP